MNWWVVAPTVGSFVIGLGILAMGLIEWWPGVKGIRDWRIVLDVLPLVLAYCYGALLIMGVGGLVGWIANAAVWGVGWVGDGALVYGVGGARQAIGTGTRTMALSNPGLLVVILCAFVYVAIRRRSKTSAHTQRAMVQGVVSGVLTGSVASVSAALAVPLASGANALGTTLMGWAA